MRIFPLRIYIPIPGQDKPRGCFCRTQDTQNARIALPGDFLSSSHLNISRQGCKKNFPRMYRLRNKLCNQSKYFSCSRIVIPPLKKRWNYYPEELSDFKIYVIFCSCSDLEGIYGQPCYTVFIFTYNFFIISEIFCKFH